jgi:hypothetical protein
MKKLLAFFAAFVFLACAPPQSTAPVQTCALFKISAGPVTPKNGEYKSQFLTRKIGTIAYMYVQVNGGAIRAWTVTDKGAPAQPKTGIEDFTPWAVDGPSITAGAFRATVLTMDTAAFSFHWMDADYNMTWKKELPLTTGIYVDPHPPQVPQGCKE